MSLSQLPPGVPLSAIPMGANPTGALPNFSDTAPSLANPVIAVGAVFAITSTFAVGARIITNFRAGRKFGWEDGLSLFALITAHTYMALIFSNHLPTSLRHVWDVPLSMIDKSYVKKTTALGFIAGPSIWASRASILLLQLRIFTPKRWFRFVTYASVVFLTVVNWSNVPVYGALCVPHNKTQSWDFALLERCLPASTHTVVVGAIGIAFDVFMLILPQPLIWKLNLSLEKKIGLALTFAAGIFATIASSISLYYRVVLLRGEDVTWNSGNVFICVFVETYTIIIVGCTPALAAFWNNTISKSAFYSSFRSLITSSSRSGSRSAGSRTGKIGSTPKSAGYSKSGSFSKGPGYSIPEHYRHSDEHELTSSNQVR